MTDSNEKFHSEKRLSPCLMTILTDNGPQSQYEKSPLVTAEQIKLDVIKNIEFILNSKCYIPKKKLQKLPQATNSVLAFGLNDFCGKSLSRKNLEELRLNIIDQIKKFEPRIEPDSLVVEIEDQDSYQLVAIMRCSGIIQLAAFSRKIAFISKMDFESGTNTLVTL